MVATTDGLVAFTGVRVGANQTADFTPVASYPWLTADVRAGKIAIETEGEDPESTRIEFIDVGAIANASPPVKLSWRSALLRAEYGITGPQNDGSAPAP